MRYSTARDLVALKLLDDLRKPFFTEKKGLEDAVWEGDDYTKWRSFEHVVATASKIHKDFKNLWKWVMKNYSWGGTVTGQHLYQFKYLDLTNLLCLLVHGDEDELNRWKECLKNGSLYVFPSEKEMKAV